MNRTFCNSMKRATMYTLCAALLGTMPILAQDNNAPPPPPQQEAPPPPPPQETMPTPPPAQDNTAPASPDNATPPRAGRRGGRMNGDRQLQRMTKELNLSQDQASQIQAIHQDMRKQVMALRDDSTLSQADRRSKMMDIRKASQDKVRAVLNDDQKTKYDTMRKKMRGRMGDREGGDNAPPPPPPPPPPSAPQQ